MSGQVVLCDIRDKLIARGPTLFTPTFRANRTLIRNFRLRQLPWQTSLCAIRIPRYRLPIRAPPRIGRIHLPAIHQHSTIRYNTLHFAQIGSHCRSRIQRKAAISESTKKLRENNSDFAHWVLVIPLWVPNSLAILIPDPVPGAVPHDIPGSSRQRLTA